MTVSWHVVAKLWVECLKWTIKIKCYPTFDFCTLTTTAPVAAPVPTPFMAYVASPMANPVPYSSLMEESNEFLLQMFSGKESKDLLYNLY